MLDFGVVEDGLRRGREGERRGVSTLMTLCRISAVSRREEGGKEEGVVTLFKRVCVRSTPCQSLAFTAYLIVSFLPSLLFSIAPYLHPLRLEIARKDGHDVQAVAPGILV